MAIENDNNQSGNSNPYDNKKRLSELNELIARKKELIALSEREAQIALNVFNEMRKQREAQGGLTAAQQKYLQGATQVLKNNEKQIKQLEALENAASKYASREASRTKSLADAKNKADKAAADAQKKAAQQQANIQRAAARQAQKDTDKSIHDAEELETLQRSIGKTLGKNSKLYEQGQVFNEEMHTTLTSVSKLLKGAGKDQEKLTKESEGIINAYKEFYTGVQQANVQLAKGEIGIKEHAEAIKGLEKGWNGVLSTLNLTGKTGKKIEAVMTAAGVPITKAGDAAEQTAKHLDSIDAAMDEIGKSGIPLASELSDAISSIGKGADAAKIAFMALGAAAGALLGKIGPGFAQANAYIKAQNDILEEQIGLRKELAKLAIEGGFIPEKIGLERMENQIQGQMEINKLAREGQFNVSKIANERLQNEIETANSVNRAMIDAQYAAQRAAVAFNQQMESGAAAFKAAAKTALSGEALGDIKGNLALLQLAGIDADNIANSLEDASEILGKSPLPEQAKQMSIFAKRTGAASSDVAELASVMEVMEGASLETSLNLQEGIRQMAKRTGQSFGRLMKGIAASSKKMLDYGILNTTQLARQVAYAKSIGLSFDAIGDAGRNMVLNYQDSIKGEMTLSALLGKSIDLSEVRQRFYEGDQPGAIEALKRSGITKEDLKYVQEQEAFKQATGGFDPNSFINILERNGKDAGELQAGIMAAGNEKFLKDFQKAQSELSAQDAIISAKTAIIDAKLSGKITEAYLKSPGYLLYQNNLNTLAQKQAALTTEIADDWLNSPENRAFQSNLNILSQEQAKLNAAIEKAFLSSKAYQDYLVETERLGVRRDLTENIIPVVTSIAGTFLFNKLGNALIGKGIGGGTNLTGTGGGITSPGGFMMMGTQGGAGFGANLSGALKSGGALTAGAVSGLTSGFMEFSENQQLGIAMGENIGRTTTKAISAGVGGWGGASLGAAIGTAIFPGVGTIIGGMLGGWLGGKGGDMLGDAVNNGIWGDKQERIKRTQEAQLQAQNELQKQMSLNRQVDISYYTKMLKLNDQQIAQLEGYNKTAVSPKWLDNPPAWYLRSGGRDTTGETYVGSGVRLPKSFEQGGDPQDIFGRKVEWIMKDGILQKKTLVADINDYIKAMGEEGIKMTKAEVEKMIKESKKGLGTDELRMNPNDPYTKELIAKNKYIDYSKDRTTQESEVSKLIKNKDWYYKLFPEEKPKTSTMRFAPSYRPESADSSKFIHQKNNYGYRTMKAYSTGIKDYSTDIKDYSIGPSKSTLNPEKQTKSVQDGVQNVITPLTNSPALSVSLWGDHINLVETLKLIQAQAHLRGIGLLGAITGVSTGIKEMRDMIVGAINRLLVFTKASSTAISTDTQRVIDDAARVGIRGMSGLAFPAYAKGTSNHPGGLALVGEKGPELMHIPSSAAIVPNQDTQRVQSGDVSVLSKWGIPGYKDGKDGHKMEMVDTPYGQFDKKHTFKYDKYTKAVKDPTGYGLGAHEFELALTPNVHQFLGYGLLKGLSYSPVDPYEYSNNPKTLADSRRKAINYTYTYAKTAGHLGLNEALVDPFLNRNPAVRHALENIGEWGPLKGTKLGAIGLIDKHIPGKHPKHAQNLLEILGKFGPQFKDDLGGKTAKFSRFGMNKSTSFLADLKNLAKGGLNKGISLAESIYRPAARIGTAFSKGGIGAGFRSMGRMASTAGRGFLAGGYEGVKNLMDIGSKGFKSISTLSNLKNTAGVVGKGILRDNAYVAIAESVWNLAETAYSAFTTDALTKSVTGEDVSFGRKLGNWVQTFGGASFDTLDSATFGLSGIKEKADASGLTVVGLDARQTANLRASYLSSHKGQFANPTNKELLSWVEQNQNWLATNGMENEINKLISLYGIPDTSILENFNTTGKFPQLKYLTDEWANIQKVYSDPAMRKKAMQAKLAGIKKFSAAVYNKMYADKYESISGMATSAIAGTPIVGPILTKIIGRDNIQKGVEWIGDKGKQVVSAVKDFASNAYHTISKSKYNPLNWFATGVDSAPGGMAMVGERGMEMMLHNGLASMIGVDGPEIRYVPKGAEILPNHKLPAMAEGTIGATAAMMASNTQQLMQIGQIIADAITSKQESAPPQNINLLVDGRQLANVQYRRQQNRLGMRPNDLV